MAHALSRCHHLADASFTTNAREKEASGSMQLPLFVKKLHCILRVVEGFWDDYNDFIKHVVPT